MNLISSGLQGPYMLVRESFWNYSRLQPLTRFLQVVPILYVFAFLFQRLV